MYYESKLHIDARMILDPLMIGLGLNMSKAKSWVDFEAMPLDRQKSCLEATFQIVYTNQSFALGSRALKGGTFL